MKVRWFGASPGVLIASFALVGGGAVACSRPAGEAKSATPNPVTQSAGKQPARPGDERASEVKKAADGVLRSIEAGDVDGFMGLVSKGGVCFGIDCDTEPLEQMRKNVREKNGFYCLLFDTECERRIVLEMWKRAKHKGDIKSVHSFKDSLRSSQRKSVTLSSETAISVEFIDRDTSSGHESWSIDLFFIQEDGTWKLTGLEYP